MDPVQQLREQLNCSLAKQLDFNNCYIDNCDISSIKLVGSDTYGALSKRWYFINGRKCLVKGNSLLGQESFAEVLASNLARVLNIKHISYTLMDASLFKDVTMNGDFKYNTICDYKLRKHLIKGTNTMSYGDFIGWLEESRCVPRNRLDLKRRLDELGLKVYDPLRIVEKTHGIMYPMDNIRIDITDIVEEWKIDNKEMNK